MYIITKLIIPENEVTIVSVHNEHIDSIKSLHEECCKYKNVMENGTSCLPEEEIEKSKDCEEPDKDQTIYYPERGYYDVNIINDKRNEVVYRYHGWITSYKNLTVVYEINETKGKYVEESEDKSISYRY